MMHLEEKNEIMEEEKAKRANDKYAIEANQMYEQEEAEANEVSPQNLIFFQNLKFEMVDFLNEAHVLPDSSINIDLIKGIQMQEDMVSLIPKLTHPR